MKFKNIRFLLPLYIVIFGIILLSYLSGVINFQKNIENSKRPNNIQASTFSKSKPVRLVISPVEIDVEVTDGNYDADNANWNVSEEYANFATVTSFPNPESGNTVIYGHNSKEIFKNLEKAKENDRALLYTEDGSVYRYKYSSISVIKPTDVGVLDHSSNPRLTLLTCKGFLNDKRIALIFDLEDYR